MWRAEAERNWTKGWHQTHLVIPYLPLNLSRTFSLSISPTHHQNVLFIHQPKQGGKKPECQVSWTCICLLVSLHNTTSEKKNNYLSPALGPGRGCLLLQLLQSPLWWDSLYGHWNPAAHLVFNQLRRSHHSAAHRPPLASGFSWLHESNPGHYCMPTQRLLSLHPSTWTQSHGCVPFLSHRIPPRKAVQCRLRGRAC